MVKNVAINDEEGNSSTTNVFFVEKKAIFDLVSSQESLVSNLMLQKTQMSAQVAFLRESVARFESILI
jgi:hypothetical protein